MRKLLIFAPLAIACSLLSGCGDSYFDAIAAQANTRNEMLKGKESYTHCLEQHPKHISTCDGYKAAYNADIEAYKATNSGMASYNNSVNINSTSD